MRLAHCVRHNVSAKRNLIQRQSSRESETCSSLVLLTAGSGQVCHPGSQVDTQSTNALTAQCKAEFILGLPPSDSGMFTVMLHVCHQSSPVPRWLPAL